MITTFNKLDENIRMLFWITCSGMHNLRWPRYIYNIVNTQST